MFVRLLKIYSKVKALFPFPFQGPEGAVVYPPPSNHTARGGLHPGNLASQGQGETDNHSLTFTPKCDLESESTPTNTRRANPTDPQYHTHIRKVPTNLCEQNSFNKNFHGINRVSAVSEQLTNQKHGADKCNSCCADTGCFKHSKEISRVTFFLVSCI